MIEQRGTHTCKNPECLGEIAWAVFVRKEYLKDDTLTVSARCSFCGTEQKWIQKIDLN